MDLLRRGVDLCVIALWLGHESIETTQIYLHADMELKERVLSASLQNRKKSGGPHEISARSAGEGCGGVLERLAVIPGHPVFRTVCSRLGVFL